MHDHLPQFLMEHCVFNVHVLVKFNAIVRGAPVVVVKLHFLLFLLVLNVYVFYFFGFAGTSGTFRFYGLLPLVAYWFHSVGGYHPLIAINVSNYLCLINFNLGLFSLLYYYFWIQLWLVWNHQIQLPLRIPLSGHRSVIPLLLSI